MQKKENIFFFLIIGAKNTRERHEEYDVRPS